MSFKSDRQRKYVMMRLKSGSVPRKKSTVEVVPKKSDIKWVFDKKKLDNVFKMVYRERTKGGRIIYGISNPERKIIFINLPAHIDKKFKDLFRNITHETLHVSGNMMGTEQEEDIINEMLDWTEE